MRTPEETLGQLDEIEARAKHITPGDWVLWVGTRDRSGAWELCRKDGVVIAARNSCPSRRVESEATALLFLYAREDVSDLVELVRHLVAERDEARRHVDARDLEWRTARRGHTDALELHMDHVQQMAAHERPLPNTNEPSPEDQHVPHIQTEDEP